VIFGDNAVCVCEEGAAPTATGCVPCGEHEVPGSTGCVCETGYARSSGSTCEAVPTALGAACSETEPCEDATFDHCQLGASHTGYCTSAGCASSSECVGGYACDTKSQPSFCKRPPTGLGKSCAAASDCADGEATFCDTFMTHVCLVEGCSLESDDCFEGWVCTDLSQFGMPKPLCLAAGAP
jgi:hypothetical protein